MLMRFNPKLNVGCAVLNGIFKSSNSRFQMRYFSEAPGRHFKENFNPFKKKSRNKNENESKTVTRMLITILGNGAIGQPRCVALFTDFKAFLFNCGEGVGRLCREYEITFSMLRHVFITQRRWENLSGLPGMLAFHLCCESLVKFGNKPTMASDVYITNEVFGLKSMSLFGPPGVENFTSLSTSSSLNLNIVKRDLYNGDNFKISHIPIKSSVSKRNPKFNDKEDCGEVIYSYVCQIFKKLGDFNPEKCVDLGVPFGQHLLNLKNGEDVVLPDGRVIYSSDVLDSTQPAITFLVVDCPSVEFLDSFVNEEQFSHYHLPVDNANEVNFVFHFSPPNIVQSKKYQNWLQKFHQSTQHFILNSSNPSISSGAVNQTQNILHLVHPEVFKLLPVEEKIDFVNIAGSPNVVHPPPMLQIHLRPEKKMSWDHVVSYNSENFNKMLAEFPDFNNELSKLKHLVSSIPRPKEIHEYPEVLFLGTSSATSTAFRNVSSILVKINPRKSILLDCGEGTFMQLVRYFGKANINSILQNISCVFITHKHTDHYLGLFEFLTAREKAFENSCIAYKPIALILPYLIQDSYRKYCQLFQSSNTKYRIFTCKHLVSPNKTLGSLEKFLDNVKIQTVPVQHCPDAYGIVLQLDSKWKIVYSGDTAPCQKLIEAGENCTLLIHEASIENNLVSEATQKMHSTPSQVAEVAERMNAQYTIMTHFSKRYLAVPLFQECNHRLIGYAFDFMKVRLHELPLLPLFLPALRCIFQEQLDSHLEKSSPVVQFENVFLKTYRSLKIR